MEKIQAQIILEILGRPPEHIREGLQNLVTKLDTEKGIHVLEKKFHEPKQLEGSKDLYTAFTEITIEADDLPSFFFILFSFMPSHVEIVYPEKIELHNYNLNDLTNRIMQRLHDYDSIAKKMLADRDILMAKLKEVAPHLIKHSQESQEPKKTSKKKAKKVSKRKKK
jgi:hypothetical protein